MASFIATPETAKTRRLRATRAEQRICDALGASPTYNSGAGSEKGDGRRIGFYRIEAKSTRTGKYRLTARDWYKLMEGCIAAGEMPIFSIDFEQYALHLLVIPALVVSDTFSYEEVKVQKGVTLAVKDWPPPCAEDEIPFRLIRLRHDTPSFNLVVFHADDLLPQLQEDE
jgi:hypothetical protein